MPPKNLIKLFETFLVPKNLIKLPLGRMDAWVTIRLYWLLKHPEYISKSAPSKNTFSKIVFSNNINFIALIYTSSESSEEQGKSLKLSWISITTFFSIFVTLFRKHLWIIDSIIVENKIQPYYWYTSMIRVYLRSFFTVKIWNFITMRFYFCF